jgi:dipeptidyl aminopeptidase/acylaminoacyl peptidase
LCSTNRHALLAVLAVPAAILLSACAVGKPQPATYITDSSATLNGDVFSDVEGETAYWFRYGKTTAYGAQTSRRTVAITDQSAYPVSAPISGLSPGTTYHWQMCVQDSEEDPPRDICSKDQTVTTKSQAGRSGIVFNSMMVGGVDQTDILHTDLGVTFTNLTNSREITEAAPAWSPDAQRIAFRAGPSILAGENPVTPGLYVMNADGTNRQFLNGVIRDPAWSPNGQKIAGAFFQNGNFEIGVIDANGGTPTNLTNHPGDDFGPAWSPDGCRLAFVSDRAGTDGSADIYVMNADGSNQVRLTTSPDDNNSSPAWAPDGRYIAFNSRRNSDGFIFWLMKPDGSGQIGLGPGGAPAIGMSWAPSGRRLTYAAPTCRYPEIHAVSANGTDPDEFFGENTCGAHENPKRSPRP